MSDKQKWWFPKLADAAYCERLRQNYPEDAGMSDEWLVQKYNDGRKVQANWDHVGDAYDQFEPLALAYLALATRPAADDAGQAVTGWRPIETAPKDGTPILGCDTRATVTPVQYVCWWYLERWAFFVSRTAGELSFKPTHWQPLPAPPAAGPAPDELDEEASRRFHEAIASGEAKVKFRQPPAGPAKA